MATLRAELPLDDALTVMRRAATHLAQVADASGRVLGLVALEDVLEMLVGEVRDPAHRDGPFAAVRPVDGSVAARVGPGPDGPVSAGPTVPVVPKAASGAGAEALAG